MRAFRVLAYVGLVLLPGPAWADVFIFNATTYPMTGAYLPVGTGHYGPGGGFGEGFSSGPVGDLVPGIEIGQFTLAQGYVAKDHSNHYCDPSNAPTDPDCILDQAESFTAAADGSNLGQPGVLADGVAIYDTAGRPLALMTFDWCCSAVGSIDLYLGAGGEPIDLSLVGSSYRNALLTAHRTVATGGLTEILDVQFYDGSVDSFGILLAPEPSAWFLLGTAVTISLGPAVKRRIAGRKRTGNRAASRPSGGLPATRL